MLRALDRRRCEELRRSLKNPHSESAPLAEQGLEEWSRTLPNEDVESLIDNREGKPVRWVPGRGWRRTELEGGRVAVVVVELTPTVGHEQQS